MTERLFRRIPLQFFAAKPEETGGEVPAVEVAEEVTEVTEHADPTGEEVTAPVTIEGAEVSPETRPTRIADAKVETPEKDAEIAQLQQELAEANQNLADANQKIAELTEANSVLTATVEDSGKSIESVTANAEAYQKSLETIVAEKEKEIPDNLKALMPADISVTEKLDWLNKAEALKQPTEEKAEPITAIGRPTPVTESIVDQSELTVTQKISQYFGGK